MTTIAAFDGVLAGDTRVSEDNGFIWTDKQQKVFKLSDGSLIGFSGDSEAGELILKAARWAAVGRDITVQTMSFPDIGNSAVSGILMTTDGSIYLTDGKFWTKWPEKYAAIGNGKPYAIAALRLGHSAVEAVQAGMAGDCFSGGMVTKVTLDKVSEAA